MLQVHLEIYRKSIVIFADLQVPTGEIYCLYGPSAGGKSSILAAIAGFESTYSTAIISLDERILVDTTSHPPVHVPIWQRRMVYLEQSARLFPHLTVTENLLYGTSQVSSKEFAELVAELGLQDYLTYKPSQLSGGLIQRVALGRALATHPAVLLLDEPFSALDWHARHSLQDLLLRLQRRAPITMVLVTHQLTEAQRLADQIALVDKGHVLQVGTPTHLMANPISWRAAQLLGYGWLLPAPGGQAYAIHSDQIVLGETPELGPTGQGVVVEIFWREGQRRVRVDLQSPWLETVEVPLSASDGVRLGDLLALTFVQPPRFSLAQADLPPSQKTP
ncbi:ABC transporter ATP-binding protein [Alicyclobacillaceae bacterium I2511]|nr:ABC transporter ATP-binding protein [Alicyclobacillaceae bacterium I2511]